MPLIPSYAHPHQLIFVLILILIPILFIIFRFLIRARILIRHDNTIQVRYEGCQYTDQLHDPGQSSRTKNLLIFQFLPDSVIP